VHVLEPQRRELREAVDVAFDLVDGDQDPLAALAQPLGDRPIVGQQARASVHDEEHQVRLVDRAVGLQRGGPQERVVRPQEQPARVDQLERGALPGRLGVVPVARGARDAVGDRLPPSADPVEQRGLAHIGPSDERDLGDGEHLGDRLTANSA
jgi:hypothetical protein